MSDYETKDTELCEDPEASPESDLFLLVRDDEQLFKSEAVDPWVWFCG